MKHELNILTNDGWVVTLLTDKPVDLGDVLISSIIVQPKEDHDARIERDTEDTQRIKYQLRGPYQAAIPPTHGVCGAVNGDMTEALSSVVWICTRNAGHDGPCAAREI
jgi:hypothetical protein